MKISADPSFHRQREKQFIQHVENLLANERLRIDTRLGRRPVTGFVRDVTRADRAIELKRLMTEMNRPDRELQGRMPVGETLEAALTRQHWFFFKQTVGRIRVVCHSPVRDLLADRPPAAMGAGDVTTTLSAMPPSLGGAPMTVVLVSTSGFTDEARKLAGRGEGRTLVLVEPSEAGGWKTTAPADLDDLADLLDPEDEEAKRQRVVDAIKEAQVQLLGSGIASDRLAEKTGLPSGLVEMVLKEYAKASPGLAARKLDGRMVMFREGSGALAPASSGAIGGSMGLMDKVRTLFSGKGDNGKKIAFLSERKAALSQQRDRAYEDMTALEKQEAELKQQFKDAGGAITKRRITGQMLQLRKDLEQRQQLLSMLNQQVNVVSTHLHNLELVQQGQAARLPDTDEITEDAVKAEEILAQLEADAELAGSVGQIGSAGMSDEEKAMFEELERETGGASAELETPTAAPARTPPTKTAERPEPASPQRSAMAEPAAPPAGPRRAKPEAG